MTREELMANRILPKHVVEDIMELYASKHTPDYHEKLTGEESAERTFVSPEKVQRMTPEEIVDCLANSYKDYETEDTDGIIRLLSVATGRTESDLRNAIFGTGSFDTQKFYEPTDLQKEVIRFMFAANNRLAELGLNFYDYEEWPKDLQDEWTAIVDKIPDGGSKEILGEARDYFQHYLDHGLPSWLY